VDDVSKPPGKKLPRGWPRRLRRLLVVLVCCYLGVALVLMALENWLVYHPVRAAQDWGAPPNERVRDLELHLADGTLIHAWWCPAEGARGAVLYCHGNAGNLSHRSGTIAALQHHLHESVLIFDYPGYGKSGGRPTEAGCYAAAEAAYDWLVQEQKIMPRDILLFGGSLGGAVAVDLASRKPHRALVLLKTFTQAPDVAQSMYPWLPVRWLMRNRFDNLGKIHLCKQPVFIVHGTTDSVVPFVQGERLFAAANEPKLFLPMEGIDHNDPVSPDFFIELRKFLARAEANAPPG
jgi:fermentation-respiration switch protein FrsA (DUF1100 family)